ncbi:MAG TPA: autoinducer synthase [Rhodospirillaceae bacterium]|nr:autoinducer synthase [Rhodospirillaceae bacterium]
MIECATIENNHRFDGNPILAQHRLRYESIIQRQHWDVPCVRGMEYDSYDNPAAYYFVKRDGSGKALGVCRLYPTDRPYMIKEAFPYMVTKCDLPSDVSVWEGSRFCVDQTLEPSIRKRIIQELVVSYLEFSIENNIKSIIGIMYPVYWKNIFIKSGWNVEWLGDVHKSAEGHKIVAGDLRVSKEVLAHVRKITGIHEQVLDFGTRSGISKKVA